MRTAKLGYTDLELTRVGLGTWAIGGGGWEFGWGPQDDKDAIDAILAALDAGVNWIDTAAIYGLGHSEELIGRALRQASHKPFIATKCGLLQDAHSHIVHRLKSNSIRDECHASLKRLGVDTIDLYQIHWPDPKEDLEQAWEQMALLAEQGTIRYAGVSNFDIEQIERIRKIHPLASLQPPYSMLRRAVEDELLDYCAKHRIGVIVYSPMQRGLLTGKFTKERLSSLAPDDHRRRSPDFQEPQFSATVQMVEELKPITERNSLTLAQLAVAWVLRRSEVTAAIVGARRPEQIKETAPAADVELSGDDIREIEQLLTKRQQRLNPNELT